VRKETQSATRTANYKLNHIAPQGGARRLSSRDYRIIRQSGLPIPFLELAPKTSRPKLLDPVRSSESRVGSHQMRMSSSIGLLITNLSTW
jgi:hypothetical protein